MGTAFGNCYGDENIKGELVSEVKVTRINLLFYIMRNYKMKKLTINLLMR